MDPSYGQCESRSDIAYEVHNSPARFPPKVLKSIRLSPIFDI